MRRAGWSVLAAAAAITTSYLAWAHGTVEGRFCGRMCRTELSHYKTSHASTNPRTR